MDSSEEKTSSSVQDTSMQDEDCYILNLESSSSANLETPAAPKKVLKRRSSCVVIDSDSDDDELTCEKKKSRIWEISSDEECLEKPSEFGERTTSQKSPVVIVIDDEDDSKMEGSEIKEGGSHDEGQISSSKEGVDEESVSQHTPPTGAEKQELSEAPEEPPTKSKLKRKRKSQSKLKREAKAKKSSGGKATASEVEQPKKMKGKGKTLYMLAGRLGMPSNDAPPSVPSPSSKADRPFSPDMPLRLKLSDSSSESLKTPDGSEAQDPDGRKEQVPFQKRPIATNVETYRTRPMCRIPGCFLHNIEKLKQYSGRNFKQNKDELIQRIYTLLNRTVFDGKLPEKLDITWNKKMLRTAGLCTTNVRHHPKRERYAQIAISLKVCDSADRIRDTLIHELCHAASWLLDGIRDSHGESWQYYARKCVAVHPELPKVTRCHNYAINYKIYYECTLCKDRIGRYSRSLNTKRFICARCKGPLVLLPLFRKNGTPIVPHVRPFAKYVQEHYRAVLRESAGMRHGDVMKKLSRDYLASKQKSP